MGSRRRIYCQAPTRSGQPCRNPVRKSGKLCYLHRRQTSAALAALFWIAKVARSVLAIKEALGLDWTIAQFSEASGDPFLAAWGAMKEERERAPKDRSPRNHLKSRETELQEAIDRLSDDELLNTLEMARALEEGL